MPHGSWLRPPYPWRGLSGFTLLEILVSFAVLGLMLAVTPMAYHKVHEALGYRAAVTDLTSTLKLGRTTAILGGRPVEVSLNLGSHSVHMPGQKPMHIASNIRLDVQAVVRTDEQGQPTPVFRFYPDGSASGGTITLTSSGGRSTRIELDWLTGSLRQVHVQG